MVTRCPGTRCRLGSCLRLKFETLTVPLQWTVKLGYGVILRVAVAYGKSQSVLGVLGVQIRDQWVEVSS